MSSEANMSEREFKHIFKDLWIKNISQTVVMSDLYRNVDELIERGISSDYLIFALNYVIKHKFKLNYPAGFKYYVDSSEIKAAYKKKQLFGVKKISEFTAEDTKDYPVYSYHAKKPTGFSDLFGGGGS